MSLGFMMLQIKTRHFNLRGRQFKCLPIDLNHGNNFYTNL